MPAVRALFVSFLLLARGGPPPDPPSAVVSLSPATICEGDGHHTEVLLDGSMSSVHLTLVPVMPAPGEAPLQFSWSLSGATPVITAGTLTSDALAVTTAGDRPLHVTLTVTNGVGGTATTLRTISITPLTRTRCSLDADCAPGVCAVDLRTCIPDHSCSSDDDCEPCFSCEAASSRCLPRTDLLPRMAGP